MNSCWWLSCGFLKWRVYLQYVILIRGDQLWLCVWFQSLVHLFKIKTQGFSKMVKSNQKRSNQALLWQMGLYCFVWYSWLFCYTSLYVCYVCYSGQAMWYYFDPEVVCSADDVSTLVWGIETSCTIGNGTTIAARDILCDPRASV